MKRQAGFTLVELVAVILILGGLSYVAFGRLADRSHVDAQGFSQQMASTLRLAQKMAIAQRRTVYVNISAGSRRIYVCTDASASCVSPLASPSPGAALDVSGPSSVVLTAPVTQFTFDALGRPSLSSSTSFTVTGGSFSATVTVEAESGYVRT